MYTVQGKQGLKLYVPFSFKIETLVNFVLPQPPSISGFRLSIIWPLLP